MTPVLSVRNLWKRYGQLAAVAGISFDVRAGTMVGLLGHNGAGKTTTIRIVLDIIKADSGEVQLFGRPFEAGARDRIGYLPEERGLYGQMKVADFLLFMGVLRRMKAGDARRVAAHWLERLELADRAQSLVSDLSKGNQQKVQLISTLIHDPPLLILDEPFSGLDPVNRHTFEQIVLEKRREGRAVIFSTHVLEQAERLLDEVIMLRKGEAVVQGTMTEVRQDFGKGWLEARGRGVGEAMQDCPHVRIIRTNADGTVRCHLEDRGNLHAVLQHLVGAGAWVERFELVEPSLNDIFLEKVGGIQMDSDMAGAIPGEAGA